MKRWIAILLCVLTAAALAGCGTKGTGGNGNSEAYFEQNNLALYHPDTFSKFGETTLVDNDDCTVRVTGLGTDPILGFIVDLYLENKTDRSLYFAFEDAAVNGVSWDPYFAVLLSPRENTTDQIFFFDTEKIDLVQRFTDIELMLFVYEENSLENVVVRETYHIYPFGEENASAHVREPLPTDNVIADNDDVTLIVTGYDPYSSYGFGVKLFFVNKTDKEVLLTVRDADVNGKHNDPWFTIGVQPGKMAYDEIHWKDFTFREGQTVSIKEIRLHIVAEDRDDLYSPYYCDEEVTLNP